MILLKVLIATVITVAAVGFVVVRVLYPFSLELAMLVGVIAPFPVWYYTFRFLDG